MLNRFVTPVTFREMWFVRGVSYIIMILNYHAGQGAFAIYLKKTHQASISKTLGVMAFINIIDLVVIYTCAILAASGTQVTFRNLDIRLTLMSSAPFFYLGLLVWILFWKSTDKDFMKPLKKLRLIKWILDHNIFMIFRDASIVDYIILALIRLPIAIVAIAAYNFAIQAFQAHIDWSDILVINPIIMVLSTIPITPSGFGTGQILTIEFYRNLVSSPLFASGIISRESLLFTSNIVWVLANMILKAIFGAYCLSKTSKTLFLETESESPVIS